MRKSLPLLLNAAILVANLAVSLGATETQARVLRTTARVAYDTPLRWPERVPETARAAGRGKRARRAAAPPAALVKYLARIDGLDALSPGQVGALVRAHAACATALREEGAQLLALGRDGARLQRESVELQRRAFAGIERTLREAGLPPGELRRRLVRAVLASAG